jgi:hypothetical protein
MRLPAGSLAEFLGQNSARPFQQFEDLGGLASVASFGLTAALAFFALSGAFLAGLAFLPDLALACATFARRAPTSGFFVAFGWSPFAVAGAIPVSSGIDVVILLSPLAVITAVTTWITLIDRKRKWILDEIDDGEGPAMRRQNAW